MVSKQTAGAKRVIRSKRFFSEEVRREVVKKIERNQLGISQASREYEVSPSAIYKWMYRYSIHLKKGNIMVVEKKSTTLKLEQIRQRVADLERNIGQKQLEIDVLNKTLEIGSRHVGFDIKKKFSGKLLPGLKNTESSTPTN